MLQYIYRIQLVRPELLVEGPTESEAGALERHASYIAELTERSKVLLAGRTQTADASAFGIVILAVASESEALELMHHDPAVKEGVMRAELFPYNIAFLSKDILELVEP